MPRCWIGLGGNVGNVRQTIARGLDALKQAGLRVTRRSQCFDTTPVGSAAGARYWNAAAELDVDCNPFDVLAHYKRWSVRRVECARSGGDLRTLDLDLLLCADRELESPTLTVPHPALWYRRFVLDPLAEIVARCAASEVRR